MVKLMFIGRLHRTIKYVIPRRPVKADVGISRYDVCFCLAFQWIVPKNCTTGIPFGPTSPPLRAAPRNDMLIW